jgi:hypothetical protein
VVPLGESGASVEELREGVLALAARVRGLSAALDVVTEIQRTQQGIDERAIAAMEAARQAQETALRAENAVVPREELDARNQADARLRRHQRARVIRRVIASGVISAVIIVALSFAVVAIRAYQVDTRSNLVQLRATNFSSCQYGNQRRRVEVTLWTAQIEADRINRTPGIEKVVQQRIAAYRQALRDLPPPRDCTPYQITP